MAQIKKRKDPGLIQHERIMREIAKREAECANEPKAIKQAFYDKVIGSPYFETFDSEQHLREYVDGTTAETRAQDVATHERAGMMAANEAKRIKREAKNPAAAMAKARAAEQRGMMADDRDEARKDAGEDWADEKDEWVAAWLAGEWTDEVEADFVEAFKAQWLKDHGSPFPAA